MQLPDALFIGLEAVLWVVEPLTGRLSDVAGANLAGTFIHVSPIRGARRRAFQWLFHHLKACSSASVLKQFDIMMAHLVSIWQNKSL